MIRVAGAFRRRAVPAAAATILVWSLGCATGEVSRSRQTGAALPGRTIHQTLTRAIALLERDECETLAVDFLSPIKRAQIPDMAAYRKGHQCSDGDRGNLDEVLMAMRLALGAEPDVHGVRAVIDLSGIGIRITQLELVRYTDGRWYFNAF
jgi:hypothetical protein